MELGERRPRLQPRSTTTGPTSKGVAICRTPPTSAALHPVSVTLSGPGTVTSNPAGINFPSACTGMFQGPVTLTATPSEGAIFNGWTGGCNGATCVVNGEASAAASFSASSHERTLTLRIRAPRVTGTLRVVDGYEPCRTRAPIIVERRSKRGWSIIRRVRTDSGGLFTVSIPRGRATYRARVRTDERKRARMRQSRIANRCRFGLTRWFARQVPGPPRGRRLAQPAPTRRRARPYGAMVNVRRWAVLVGSLWLAGMCGGAAGSASRPVGALAQMPKRTVCDAESNIKGCLRVRAFNSPQALAVSPDGRFLYVAVSPGASVVTFSRNLKTGALRQLAGSFGCERCSRRTAFVRRHCRGRSRSRSRETAVMSTSLRQRATRSR